MFVVLHQQPPKYNVQYDAFDSMVELIESNLLKDAFELWCVQSELGVKDFQQHELFPLLAKAKVEELVTVEIDSGKYTFIITSAMRITK